MNHLKTYNIFENQNQSKHPGFPTTEEEIHKLCKKYGIGNYTINDDLSLDVDGNVDLNGKKGLMGLPLNFNYVSGDFRCDMNFLITLKGSPKKVDGHFVANTNNLTSLKHVPKYIGKDLYAVKNDIVTFGDVPEYVGGDFYMRLNPIFTLIEPFILFEFLLRKNYLEILYEFNEYLIIKNDEVYLGRLKSFVDEFDLEMPDLEKVKKYYKIV